MKLRIYAIRDQERQGYRWELWERGLWITKFQSYSTAAAAIKAANLQALKFGITIKKGKKQILEALENL